MELPRPEPIQDEHPEALELPVEVGQQPNEPGAEQPHNEAQNLGMNVQFNLTGYSRGPNSGRSCIFHSCENTSRHRIAETIKMKMIMDYNYYIPPEARVCTEHMHTDSWAVLLNAPNQRFDFNPHHMLNIIQLLKQYNNRLLNFEEVENLDEAELHYWTGRTLPQFLNILEQTPSLSSRSQRPRTTLGVYLVKIRTGEPDDRLASIFHMTRQNIEKKIKNGKTVFKGRFCATTFRFQPYKQRNHCTTQSFSTKHVVWYSRLHKSIIDSRRYIRIHTEKYEFFISKRFLQPTQI